MILWFLLQQNEKNLPYSDLLLLVRSYQVLASYRCFKVCFTMVSSCIYCRLKQCQTNIFIKIKIMFSFAILIPEIATCWVMTVVTNIQNMWRNHLLFNGCGPEELLVALNSLCQDKLVQMPLSLSSVLGWRGQCFLQNTFIRELNHVEFPGKRESGQFMVLQTETNF